MRSFDMIVVCGPTASGKTSAAIKIAKLVDAEIISADSMQIYKEMNIGTAKPDLSEQDGVIHYNLGSVSVYEQYSVNRFVSDANEYIKNIKAKGKQVVIVGGTGLYIDSLINNVSFIQTDNDVEYREYLKSQAEEKGNEYLFSLLEKTDPKAAADIHPNNVKRVIRALEIINSTGLTIDEVNKQSIRDRIYKPLFIGINYRDRNILYDRINKRVDIMMEQGLLCEAKELYSKNISQTAYGAIGYKEIFEYFSGKCTLEESVELIKKNSRNYAKRQITWFKRNKEINWFYPDEFIDQKEYYHTLEEFVSKNFEV